jgi:DnaK suppressor protein
MTKKATTKANLTANELQVKYISLEKENKALKKELKDLQKAFNDYKLGKSPEEVPSKKATSKPLAKKSVKKSTTATVNVADINVDDFLARLETFKQTNSNHSTALKQVSSDLNISYKTALELYKNNKDKVKPAAKSKAKNKKETTADLNLTIPPQTPKAKKDTQTLEVPKHFSDDDDTYMNDEMKAFFLKKLNLDKTFVSENVNNTMGYMRDNAENLSDVSDKATQEEEFSKMLKTRDRERMLAQKINEAISLINNSEDYGYCVECGNKIGFKRMLARPTATLCTDCKTIAEKKEHIYG